MITVEPPLSAFLIVISVLLVRLLIALTCLEVSVFGFGVVCVSACDGCASWGVSISSTSFTNV